VAEAVKIVAAICAQVPATGRLVIGGDFNVKSLGERLASEQIRVDNAERRALHEFRQRGLAIAWRDVHPRRALPQTLRWRRAPTTPFHCDGFLTRGFPAAAMACDILCSAGEARVSDHNPVILQLPTSLTSSVRLHTSDTLAGRPPTPSARTFYGTGGGL
jgi:exonuclease III